MEGTGLRHEGKTLKKRDRRVGAGLFQRDPRGAFSPYRWLRETWNKLPEDGVKDGIITTLKRHLDMYMNKKSLFG